MGKYIRKAKKAGDVSPLGVLTRAKALALNGGDGGSYLELRSRRLVKPFTVLEGRRQKNGVSKNPNLVNPNPTKIPNVCVNSEEKESLGAKEMENLKEKEKSCCGPEDSFGENLLEEGRKRTTRESTPCSLIRDSDNIPTPGSSTRRTNANVANSGVVPNSTQATMPTSREMDEFFAHAEAKQQRRFIEKYNFDPVNDKPLPGRFEWVKVDP